MRCEVLISTMNCKDKDSLTKEMQVNDCVIINQVTKEEAPMLEDSKSSQRIFSFKEKGLSRSRNKALKRSIGDICIIADDDLQYVKDYEKIIKEGYKKYPDADIIAFHADNVDLKRRRPKRKEGKINLIKSMRIQSVQVTFKRKSIINKKVFFNEKFGAGSEFYSGEENIFLAQCLKKKLKIYYIPETITVIQDNDSTWFHGYDELNFNVKGAVFYAMSKSLYPLLILQFAIRKRKDYINDFKTLKAIKCMFYGVKKYKLNLKE